MEHGLMLNHAIMKLKQLIYDDSGIAMAYTVLVFLFFFLLCASVAAMTENIRQKMELQNACDAAAYSGAVVQADMLSRIAVLNRALSWTYLQTNKRQMDYLVGLWADQVRRQHSTDFNNDSDRVKDANRPGCGLHGVKGVNYYASIRPADPYLIKMRGYEEVDENVKIHIPSEKLTEQIGYGEDNMRLIMSEISYIRNNINIFIKNAVDEVWTRSGMSDSSYQSGNLLLLLGGKNDTSGPDYFSDVNDEDTFLAFSGSTASDMGNGQGEWWILKKPNIIIQRSYVEGGLTAQYICYSEQWSCNQYGHTLVGTDPNDPRDVTLEKNYSSLEVTGTSLKKEFFGKAGSIVVAAKRRLANPFSWMDDLTEGLYAAFTPEGKYDMWAVSAARAGVRLGNNPPGHYEVQYPGDTVSGYTNGVWNLCEEDWDGVLIPVSRAWNETEPGKWDGDITSEELLKEVKDKLNIQSKYESGIGKGLKH